MKKAMNFIEVNIDYVMMLIALTLSFAFVALCSYAAGLMCGIMVTITTTTIFVMIAKDIVETMIEKFNKEVED